MDTSPFYVCHLQKVLPRHRKGDEGFNGTSVVWFFCAAYPEHFAADLRACVLVLALLGIRLQTSEEQKGGNADDARTTQTLG